ncbi:hypothetical protein D3C81_2014910 [compost metagenome]
MNLDTLGRTRDESAMQAISAMLRETWLTVTDSEHHGVTNITPIIINRSVRGTFTVPFNQLTAQVQVMSAPLATARTGIVG